MKQKKCVISMLLLFMVALVSIVGILPQKVEASEDVIPYDQYKAEYYINYSSYKFMMSDKFTLPYRTIVENNSNSAIYKTLISAWEVATFELSNVLEYSEKRIGYYEAFLFDILYSGYEPQNLTGMVNEGIVKSTEASLIKKVSKFFQDEYYWKIPINDLDEDKYQSLQQALTSCEEIKEVMGIIGDVGKVLNYASNIEDLLYKLAKVQVISQLSIENANVLESMGSSTSDKELQKACYEMAAICQNQLSQQEVIALMSSEMLVSEGLKWLFDEIWKDMLNCISNYGIAISVGQEAGKWATNLLFSTEEQIEVYYEMEALYHFENELRKVVVYYEKLYTASKTTRNAKLFNAAFEMLANVFVLGCDISIEHERLNNEGGVVSLFVSHVSGNHKEYEEYKKSLTNIKTNTKFVTSYAKNEMYDSYRDIYCRELAEDINMPVIEKEGTPEDVKSAIIELKSEIFKCCDVIITEDMILGQDLKTYGSVYLSSGILDLNGYTLSVAGNLYQTGGTLKIEGGTLDISKNYIIAKENIDSITDEVTYQNVIAQLVMTKENDTVKVGQDFFIYSSSSGSLTAGTMYIGGNITQIGNDGSFADNFKTSGTHTVILNGTGNQILSLKSDTATFTNLKVSDNYTGTIILKDKFSCTKLLSDINFTSEDAVIYDLDLNGYDVKVQGDVSILKSIDLNGGNLNINGSLQQLGGILKIKGGTLDISKNYIIAKENIDSITDEVTYQNVIAQLVMTKENDTVKIGQDFFIYSSSSSYLTAGTMYIGGNFTQIGDYRGFAENFKPSEKHTVVLNGVDVQYVSFESELSYFNNLLLTKNKDTGYIFVPEGCWKNLIINQENPFLDVLDSMYYYQPVLWALENKITAGISATEFAPEQSCTRGQVVTFLWRAMGCPEPSTTTNPFVDLNSNEYYYKAVLWALENGITAGINATQFAPDETVTRGQFVTFLHRAENKPSYSVSNPFGDVSNAYYYDAVLWAYENGVTAGINTNEFAPEDFCTRGQVVTFLYRALNDK